MSDIIFDYEFIFIGSFNLTTYLKCNIKDIIGNRSSIIQNKCIQLQITFNKVLGSRIFSTFAEYDNKIYKITLNKSEHATAQNY